MLELLLGVAWADSPLVGDQGRSALDPELPAGLELSADSCAGCHESVAAEWRGSRHAVASTNPTFWEAWTRFPLGWCVNCHAPLAQAQRQALGGVVRPGAFVQPPEPVGLWGEGVTCAACHLQDGAVLSASPPTDAAEAAHPVRVEPRLATADACAGCHDFPFQHHDAPLGQLVLGQSPAQATVREWATSTAADRGQSCQDCHMGEHGHAFPGAHRPELVRELLQVSVQVEGPVARFVVAAPGAAHRVPTGDPFRRLVLRTCEDAACEAVVDQVDLRRVFALTGQSWELATDRTVPPETARAPAERVLELSAAGASWWVLDYRFADPDHEAALPPAEVGYRVMGSGLQTSDIPGR